MKLTYSIKTVLRPDKKKADGTIPIYFSVRVGPYTTRIPTGKFTLMKDWNVKDNCPKKNCKANQLLASYLGQKLSAWELYMLELETLGKPITIIVATNFFKENTKVCFYSFFEEQIKLWEESKQPCTLKSYKSTLNVLRQYNPKLNFGDLTYEFLQRWDLHMGKVRGNSVGGKFTRHKCLKAIINEAIKKGFMPLEYNPYRYFKIKASTGKRNFLSIEEVRTLMRAEISEKNTLLNKVRDLFLFSCFTGLRYSDVMNLKFENIKTNPDVIKMKMSKTGKEITIPLTSNAKEIIEKYSKHVIKTPGTKVLPALTNQVLNRSLKELMRVVSVSKHISFHCARHSFASNLLQNKTNIVYVKDLLGHTKISQTQIYTTALQSDLFTSMESLQDVYSHAG